MEVSEVGIYVLPTEENMPPRAALYINETLGPEDVPDELKEEAEDLGAVAFVALSKKMVSWSNDTGMWLWEDGLPVPADLGEAITEHAKNLGVEW